MTTEAPHIPVQDSNQSEAPLLPKKRKSFVVDAMHVLSSNATQNIASLVIGIIIARLWGADARGLLAIAVVLPNMIAMISEVGTSKVLPYMIGQKVAPLDHILSVALSRWAINSAIGIAICIGYAMIPGTTQLPMLWIALAAAIVPLFLFKNYLRALALGFEEIRFFARLGWLRNPVVLLVLVVLGFGPLRDHPWIYLLGLDISLLVVALYGLYHFRNKARIRFGWDRALARRMFKDGIIFGLGAILMKMNYRIDLLILGLAFLAVPAADTGNYSVGVNLANQLWQASIALNFVLFSRSVNSKDPLGFAKKAARLARVSTAISIPPAIALYIIAPWIFPFIYGPGFEEAGQVTRILLPGIVAFFAARTFEADLTGKGHPWAVVSIMAPVVIGNIILNFLWIPRFGIFGAAWASTVTYCLGTVGLIFIYSRVTGLSLKEICMPRISDFSLKRRSRKKPEPASADPLERVALESSAAPDMTSTA